MDSEYQASKIGFVCEPAPAPVVMAPVQMIVPDNCVPMHVLEDVLGRAAYLERLLIQRNYQDAGQEFYFQ